MILNLYLLYLYNMYNIRYHISIYIVYCGRLGKMPRGPRVQRERAMPSLCGDGAPSAQGRTPPQLMEKLENASKIEGIFRDLQGFSTMFLPFFGSRCGWCGFSVCFLRFPTRYQYCTSNSRAAYLWQNDLLSHDGLASLATLAFQSPIGSLLDDIPHMFSLIGVQCIHEIHVLLKLHLCHPCPGSRPDFHFAILCEVLCQQIRTWDLVVILVAEVEVSRGQRC